MALRVDERYRIRAPVDEAWDFLVDPRRVVTCVPGGALDAIVDARTYDGRVRVRLAGLTFAYRGRVWLAEVDVPARRVRIVGDARARRGEGSARLSLESWLVPQPGGITEVRAEARVEVGGALVALGRGFLEAVGHEVFRRFAARVRAALEGREAVPEAGPLLALPVLAGAARAWLAGRRGGAAGR